VGSAGLMAVIYLAVKPTYEASSLLRAEPTMHELFVNNRVHNALDSFDSYLETQVQLLTGTNVLLAAAADPAVAGTQLVRQAGDAEAELRDALEVKILPKSSLIKVSTRSKSAVEAASIVNAVVKAFLAHDAVWSEEMTRQQITTLELYQRELKAQVDDKHKEWLALAAKGDIDPIAGTRDKAGGEAPT